MLICLSGTLQLVVAVATTTLVIVTGIEGILGLGPAIFLTTAALAAFPAGKLMDRHGRVPVLAVGCLVGTAATSITALGCLWDSAALVVLGFALVGVSNGTVLLARAAAADMVRPSGARGRSRSSSPGRSWARCSARSCSARSSPGSTSTRTTSSFRGSRPAAS